MQTEAIQPRARIWISPPPLTRDWSCAGLSDLAAALAGRSAEPAFVPPFTQDQAVQAHERQLAKERQL